MLSIPMEQLTDSQRKAVFHVDGPVLVLAGPGSGKTRVITTRIAALINSGVRPYNICAITFTNKAADEMAQRVAAFGVTRGVHISTFHSLCVRLLRTYAGQAGVKSNFSIYDDSAQLACMKEAIKVCQVESTNFSPKRMLESVSRLKNDLETPELIAGRADDYFSKNLARIYVKYQRILANNNALDFDDLLVKTAFLLRDNADVRTELGGRFRYLLVDEYQDTNHAQYQIARGLALEHGNICVTGDPDQSVYGWRGADIANILAFEKDWPNAVVVRLEENFRSTPNILALADTLISLNTKRKQKVLVPTRERGNDVAIDAFWDEAGEAGAVAGKIEELSNSGADLNEIAVFYRVNSMSRAIEEAFVTRQIPYQIVRGMEFYSRKEIRDMLGYLKLVANPDDDVAFRRAVNTHPRGIGKTTLERVGSYGLVNGLGMYAAASRAGRIASVGKGAQGKLVIFCNMIEGFRAGAEGAVAPLIERIFAESGLKKHLKSSGEKGQAAIENVGELINAAGAFDENAESPSLLDYLQMVSLYSDTDAYDSEAGKVSLMTLHAAKGLEFENVFIVGVEDGLLPHERSRGNADELEEERRLFFVGMTRAKNNLHISYARERLFRGQHMRTIPSQFLYEVGYEQGNDFEEEDDGFDEDFSQVAPEADLGAYKFAVGQVVEHSKFGAGVIKEFHNMGENSIAVVRFNSGKTKSLMVKYAKLSRINRR
ncbi:MAG: ATP-dependent helicase [Planctomycetota bacterium]